MKIQVLDCKEKNSGQLAPIEGRYIVIKKGRYVDSDVSHPLYTENEKYFKKIFALESSKKYSYFFYQYGIIDKNVGLHVGFNWMQHQRFLLLQNRHWFQKEESIRYLVNLIFLALGAYMGFKNLK